MHSSSIIALLFSATAVYASPLGARGTNGTSTYAATALLGNPTATPNPPPEKGLIGMLLDSDTETDRFIALQAEVAKGKADFKFDFSPAANPNTKPGKGGAVFLANRKAFPAVTDLGLSGAGLFFAPCGLNTPHIHPRASEFLTVATDSNILSGFVLENGDFSTEVNETLTQYQGMVFPQGSIHFQQNLDCTPAVAISVLNSDDPGVSSMAQNFLVKTDPSIVEASIGFPAQLTAENFQQFKNAIPTPFVAGVQECYKRCGLSY